MHFRQTTGRISAVLSRINENCALADMIINGRWSWPEEWNQHVPMLVNIPFPRLNESEKDGVKWKNSEGKLAEFKVKHAWWDLRDKMETVKWWKVVWFPQCNPRNAFILWMAVMGKLYTQDRIQKWSNDILLCPLCNKINDSHDHLFFKCEFAKEIWSKLKSRMNMNNIPSEWKELIEKIAECPCNNAIRSVVRRLILADAVYYIWKERNSRIFAGTKTK